MSANRNQNILKCASVFVTFVAACGGTDPTPIDPLNPQGSTVAFHRCAKDGQIYVANAEKKPVCADPPSAKPITFPASCTDSPVQALNSDGTTLSCVNVPQGGTTNPQNARIDMLLTKITDLTTTANNIKNSGGARAVYQGGTTNTSKGNMLQAGDDNALVSAAKLCAAQYGAGAHMCTVDEIYYSVLAGKISTANQIATKQWVYVARGTNPISGSSSPLLGLGDNCGSYTYPTGDKFWSGTAVSTAVISETTRWGVRFHTGSDATCSSDLKIACCK